MGDSFISRFIDKLGRGVVAFIKAAVISSIINFFVLVLAFYILDIPLYGLVALAVAVVDLLPVLGTGVVLLPWSLIVLIQGNFKLALGLVLTYLVTFLINQISEPLILGKKIGLKPLYTLAIVVVSMLVLGPVNGALVGSLISIVLASYLDIKKDGYFDSFIDSEEEGKNDERKRRKY